jgi:glycyl-tRNA synthetase beta chain
MQIMLARAFSLSLRGLIQESLELLQDKISGEKEQHAQRVLTFFQHRMEHLLAEEGFAKDLIAAVVTASMDDIPAVPKRTHALQSLKAKPDFEPLAIAFKRVVNIIRQAKELGEVAAGQGQTKTNPGLFQEPCEQALYGALQKVEQDISEDLKTGAFDRALLTVATLKQPVDGFFEGVMVLTEDQSLRQNRLALLGEIAGLFSIFADFSKIST